MYLRDAISISKINAAFLTGQQINRIHVQQLLFTMFVCKPHNTQRLLLYHEPSNSSIDPYAKKEPDFSWDVPIDILKSILQGRAACIEKCRSKGGWGTPPTSILQRKKCFCIDENIACGCYEASHRAFQNLKIILQIRPSVFKFNLKRTVIFLHKNFCVFNRNKQGELVPTHNFLNLILQILLQKHLSSFAQTRCSAQECANFAP